MGIFNWFEKRDKPSEKKFPDIACPKCKVLNKDSAIRCRYCNYEFPLIPKEGYDTSQNVIKILDQPSVKESKIEISSQELYEQAKNALEQRDIDKAAYLAFLARKKEFENKGLAFTENTPFGNPLFTKNFVQEANNINIPIGSINDYEKEQLKLEIMQGMLEGKSSREVSKKINNIISDFEWDEFDKFYKLFEESGKWPYLWDKIEKYAHLQKCTTEELLNELNKTQLFEIADKYSVKLKKSYKKDKIIETLINNIPEHNKNKILEIVNQKWKPKFLDAKRFLLTHTLSMYSFSKAHIKEFHAAKEAGVIIEQFEILPADTNCFICKEMVNKKFSIAPLKKENIPPFHPGCRCMILPFSERWEELSKNS